MQLQLQALASPLPLRPAPSWLAAARAGLASVLRSRSSPVQRYSALQLACCLAELAGPAWLLGPGCGTRDKPGSFLQLLLEAVNVRLGCVW